MSQLTDEQIDALTGRALDAEIARHVFGWVDVFHHEDEDEWYGFDPAFGLGRGLRVAEYSTDPADSEKLLDRMLVRHSYALWESSMLSSVTRGPIAAFVHSVHPPKWDRERRHPSQVQADGDGARLEHRRFTAIARAALKAVREEKP